MLELTRALIVFGMYSLTELTALFPLLTKCLDTQEAATPPQTPQLVRGLRTPVAAGGPVC